MIKLPGGKAYVFAVSSLLCALAGCGGGSDGDTPAPASPPTVTVSTAPGAPTIGAATAGDGRAVIAFTAPPSGGSSTITSYTATCTANSVSAFASFGASPIAVTGLNNGSAYACSVTATNAAGTSAPSALVTVTPVATPSTSGTIDPTRIPLGDGKLSTTTPQVGYVFSCTIPSSANPPGKAPWINADGLTWDSTAKLSVQGAVQWVSQFLVQLVGSLRNITGNGLPSHVTGTFPIAATDPARAYDGNPNHIDSVAIAWGLPGNPSVATRPTCLSLGAIGVLVSGARLFNALDADGRDAVAHEVQDSCEGHPQGASIYHYHDVTHCLQVADTPTEHSPLVGYIADGFGLYGYRGEGGKLLTNADLDECHGHAHTITVGGNFIVQYHYHATREYPYTVGCYRGTPVTVR